MPSKTSKRPPVGIQYRFHSCKPVGGFTPFKVVFEIRSSVEAQAFHDNVAMAITDVSLPNNNLLTVQANEARNGDFSIAPVGVVRLKEHFKE